MNNMTAIRSRRGKLSFLIDKKAVMTTVLLFGLLLLLFIAGLSIGSTMLHPVEVFKHLLGMGTGEYNFIIDTIRLPRMLLSLLVGAALGVSGLILQGIVRNPLASPDIIGITGGASVAAVIFIVYFSAALSMKWLPLAAILGATLISLLIYSLAWKKGVTPIRLVLIGIGVAASTGACTTMMIVLSSTASLNQAYIWMTGSVYGANWNEVTSMLTWLLISVPLALFFSRSVNVQELGDQVAIGLGARVQRDRFCLLLISVALAGSAVAYAGGIGFVGLIAPHISRKIVGRSFASVVPVCAMIGGLIVCAADIIARTAFLPLDIPAGVFTAGIGAPFFIYLLFKNRNN
ncbi:iron ABC transporter permease [Paenibacillus oenotherae]|uniref:Iron ABC transporter permease n=1 Tax=Paenibacillus oenotherae TaxID=1435645 RepID=A0ABS7D5D4_9BACL|nr:iron ABC transporter permease [Paenibacillus oenotherae]MBW7474762.1 iron ABC transporter permease [Paenibacillus oenotherae]